MGDQAATLRGMVGQRPQFAKVLTFASGKGGVGKSNIIINTAIAMAGMDLRILLLDMDLGLANIDILLGLTPHYNLTHVMSKQKTLTDIILPGPNDVMFIPGASGVSRLANLKDDEREFLIDSFSTLETKADLLMIDTGAGISENVLQFALASQALIVVTTPEPTARMDAYALIKTTHRMSSGRLPCYVIVNEVESPREAEQVFASLNSVCEKHLSYSPHYLGHVPCDPVIPKAVKQRRPFVLSYPTSGAARSIGKIANTMQRLFLPHAVVTKHGVDTSFFTRLFSSLNEFRLVR